MLSLKYINVHLYNIKLVINEILNKIKKKYHVSYLNKNIIKIL